MMWEVTYEPADLEGSLTKYAASISAILVTLTAVFVVYLYYTVFYYPFHASPLRYLPGPTDNVFFLGQSLKFLNVSWLPDLFRTWSRQWPDAHFIRYLNFANSETLIVNSITAYREILCTKNSSFVKPEFARRFAASLIGDGLPFAEGEKHRERRTVFMKSFISWKVKDAVLIMQAKARQWTKVLRKASRGRDNIEVQGSLWKAVLDVISNEIVSLELGQLEGAKSPFFDAITTLMSQSSLGHIINFLNSVVPCRRALQMVPACRDFMKASDKARLIIRELVLARYVVTLDNKLGIYDTPDVLQNWLNSRAKNWDCEETVEYVMNLLVLGHDTTACAIAWAIHELSCHPLDQRRLRQEAQRLFAQDEWPTYDDIERLQFLHNFVREVLRLYCPVALSPRKAAEEVEIAGHFIPRGTIVQLCPAVINRSSSIWGPDANVFNPDRWIKLPDDLRDAFAFETFHHGARGCIGRQLAMTEIKVFVMELVVRFDIRPPRGGPRVKVKGPTFTLKPEKMEVRLFPRRGAWGEAGRRA